MDGGDSLDSPVDKGTKVVGSSLNSGNALEEETCVFILYQLSVTSGVGRFSIASRMGTTVRVSSNGRSRIFLGRVRL